MSKTSSTITLLLDLGASWISFNLRCAADVLEAIVDHLCDEEPAAAEPNTHRAGDLEVSALTAVAEDDRHGCDLAGCRMCQLVTDGAL